MGTERAESRIEDRRELVFKLNPVVTRGGLRAILCAGRLMMGPSLGGSCWPAPLLRIRSQRTPAPDESCHCA
jgi:hypothetical protein